MGRLAPGPTGTAGVAGTEDDPGRGVAIGPGDAAPTGGVGKGTHGCAGAHGATGGLGAFRKTSKPAIRARPPRAPTKTTLMRCGPPRPRAGLGCAPLGRPPLRRPPPDPSGPAMRRA